MTVTVTTCAVGGCQCSPAAALEGQTLCRAHFIAQCYARLDHFEAVRKSTGLQLSDTDAVRRFIHECSRAADEIEHQARDLDNLERAQLVHIILSASELGRYLRRSPRKAVSIAVRLTSERLGGSWEEETETVLLSQYGALVRCKHPAKPGETLQIERADTGEKTEARVSWQGGTDQDSEPRIAVEFLSCDNFWGLDWAALEQPR
jgi:hypothetical protein